ncbi:hypothetical protein [Microvirga calopogonii]|uniref:hypothetical protein n=1 Tax=Microvirga calopogonii TaxID=2078013 RepID=UPI0013B44551|nr:hypothetical protein [Microvirga calopogonii]
MTEEKEDGQARFEALLAQALGDDEKALAHRAAKDLRNGARMDRLKSSFKPLRSITTM